MANEKTFTAGSNVQNYYSSSLGDGYYTVGKHNSLGDLDGAVRFPGVSTGKSIQEARLYLHVDDIGTGSNVRIRIKGIDEDNTAAFSGSPFGRTETTAQVEWDQSLPSEGGFTSVDVTAIVQEILGRAGWNTNNSVGFLMREIGTSSADAWFSGGPDDVPPSSTTSLLIRESANPNFSPTPITVAAPTIPDPDDFGFRMSAPGVNVLTATGEDVWFDSSKETWKTQIEGEITTAAGVPYSIPHGLAYRPAAIAYVKTGSSTKRYMIPRYFPSIQQDPDGDTSNAEIYTDATNVYIRTTGNATVYYHLFIDELP